MAMPLVGVVRLAIGLSSRPIVVDLESYPPSFVCVYLTKWLFERVVFDHFCR